MGALRMGVTLLACLFLPIATLAQAEICGQVLDLHFVTQDLEFVVQDMGGAIESLALKETDTEIRIELASDVLFAFDSASLQPKAQEALRQVAEFIREKAKGEVRIEGHTDAKGSDSYNRKLSERRAKAVLDWLQIKEGFKGLKGVRFTSKGYGESRPVAPNANADGTDHLEGRQKNRRVEIVVRKVPTTAAGSDK